MKVPLYQQKAAPTLQGVPDHLQFEKPGGFEALQQAGGAIGSGVDKIEAQADKARHEAAVAEARDNLTAYGNEQTDTLYGTSDPTSQQAGDAAFDGTTGDQPGRTSGFLELKGRDAAAASAGTLDTLEQTRQKRAANIKDPTARRLFLQESAQMASGAHRTVEEHVGREIERAKDDSINAAADEAVRAAAVDPGNDQLAAERIANVVGPAHAMGRGQEWEDKKALELQERVATTRMDALLAKGDTKAAERVLDSNKWALGDKLAPYQAKLEKAQQAQDAESIASGIVRGAFRPDGSLNDRKAMDALDKVPPDKRDNVRPIALRMMTEAEQAYKAEGERITTQATAAFAKTGWTKEWETGLGEQLRQRNPERYLALRNSVEAKWRRVKDGGAEARREQAARDREALNDFKAMSPEEQANADVDSFLADRDVSTVGKSALGPVKAAAKRTVEKGLGVPMQQFVEDFTKEAEPFAPTGTTKQAKDARKAWDRQVRADAVDAWTEAQDAHPDKKPTLDELSKKKAERFSGYVPSTKNPESVKRAAQAIVQRATPSAGGKTRPSFNERVQQLKAAGKSKDEARSILKSEGY